MTTVRFANPADAEQVRQIGEQAFADARCIYRPSSIALEHAATHSSIWERLVAEEEGGLVGTVRFDIDGSHLRVVGLGVLPDSRRRQVARRLIDALVAVARERGCPTLSLYTVKKTGNVPIFQRLGFNVVAESIDEFSVSVTGEPLIAAYMERNVRE